MANELFEIVNSITYDKKPYKELSGKYNAFIVNRFLKQNKKAILAVNEMNKNYFLDNDMQYDFLKRVIPKHKSFDKHVKKNKDNDVIINNVCMYYGINKKRAMEYIEEMTSDQIQLVADKLSKGITKHNRKRFYF